MSAISSRLPFLLRSLPHRPNLLRHRLRLPLIPVISANQSFHLSVRRRREEQEDPPLEEEVEGSEKKEKSRRARVSASSNIGKKDGSSGSSENAVQKPLVPEVYPQVLALPIARRPLFPGFYKAVVIKSPPVIAAVKELMKRGQPYIGAFLLKDEDSDTDLIIDIDQVYSTGVFAQITSIFPVKDSIDEEQGLTAVLYPHRRIRINELITPAERMDKVSEKVHTVTPLPSNDVTSFEEVLEDPLETESPLPYANTLLQSHPVSLVNVTNLVDRKHDRQNSIIKAVTAELVSVFKDIAAVNPLFRDQIANFSMSHSASNMFEEPARLADFAAAVSSGEINELQAVLESLDVEERLQKALLVLKKELLNAQLQSKISKDVESKIQKRQKEFYLMEQMKGIKRELGIEGDGKDKMIEKFKLRVAELKMPETVSKVFNEEISKLAHLEPAASEFNVTRNYLDWLTQIPWGQRSPENFNIAHAMKVLDEDHHGLNDVKDRILEFIAVGKLRGTVEGKILCLVGPPGVGKTSIGKSIARALGRQFYRFSVGGLNDVAEIKGHRRTYVGAMPGKMAQALKKVQTENPLLLIDEVDKIGKGHQGDPSSALLELLDPEQNSSFLDHYMDVPLDLSTVLFVCTANITDTIPAPLMDRMEVIHLSGYVADEKMAIAQKYLAPKAKEEAGLKDADVQLTDQAIESLIKSYCRESGVRNLQKQIEKVYRKAALKIVRDLGEENISESEGLTPNGKDASKEEPKTDEHTTTTSPRVALKVPSSVSVEISPGNLKDYVGPPVFTSDRLYEVTPPGIAMGLAWTSMGGASLYVESILESLLTSSSKAGLQRTGHLGDVMKESTTIAYTYAKAFMHKTFPENRFFEHAKLHLHCPEGAVPKDGPSAGITMTTSLLSLALDHPVEATVAMTGELTLTGKVLKIGGLREKAVAAKRSGITTIIFPKGNESDWEELPANIKDGLTGISADWYSDVFKVIFASVDEKKAKHLWKEQLKKPRKNNSDNDD